MTDAQQKYLTEQQAFVEAKAKSTKSVLTEMPTSTRPRQLARARQCPKEFGLGVRIGYETPGSGFFSFVDESPVSGFSSSVDSALVSGGAPVSGFSSSVVDLPGSGVSSFVGAATASGFPLHDSSRFSTLDAGFQQADQMLSRVHLGNDETSTYPATQVPVRVTTQVPVRVIQFNASNPPNARQPTLPSITRQPLSLGPPTARQSMTSAPVHASGASWEDFFTSEDKSPSITCQPFSSSSPPARQPTVSAPVHASGALWGDSFTSKDKSPSTTRQPFSLGPPTARQLVASASVHVSGALLRESISQDFASKDKETISESQLGPRVPFADRQHPLANFIQGRCQARVPALVTTALI